jgi:hypothetical protein
MKKKVIQAKGVPLPKAILIFQCDSSGRRYGAPLAQYDSLVQARRHKFRFDTFQQVHVGAEIYSVPEFKRLLGRQP